MSRISANDYSMNSFSSFFLKPKKDASSQPYYYDEERAKRENLKESRILPSDFSTKCSILKHKIANTLTVYPVKGFSGDKNSNFYEFLTMGMFPYITGGLTFIALFNSAAKFMNQHDGSAARKLGFRMALGVVFYALAKSISQKLVSIPVKLKTGIDMNLPCRNVVNLISSTPEQYAEEEKRQEALKKAGSPDYKSFEYHKAFESVDFPRFDVLYNKDKKANRNEYYDMIAEKNGFGKNLKDSDQEVKPFIKQVVTKAKTAQNISKYLWAAVGVGIGMQEPWEKLLDIKNNTSCLPFKIALKENAKFILKTAKDSCKAFFNGGVDGQRLPHAKIAGRTLLGLAILTTVIGTINAMRNPYIKNEKEMNSSSVFKDNSKVVED